MSRTWKCPKCGEEQRKAGDVVGKDGMLADPRAFLQQSFKPGGLSNLVDTETCTNCGAQYSRNDVRSGKYDVQAPEVLAQVTDAGTKQDSKAQQEATNLSPLAKEIIDAVREILRLGVRDTEKAANIFLGLVKLGPKAIPAAIEAFRNTNDPSELDYLITIFTVWANEHNNIQEARDFIQETAQDKIIEVYHNTDDPKKQDKLVWLLDRCAKNHNNKARDFIDKVAQGTILAAETPRDTAIFLTKSKEKAKLCFIATAVCGVDSQEVMILHHFRDQVLLKSFIGRLFVEIYYKVSPPVASLIKTSPIAQYTIRKTLVCPFARIAERKISHEYDKNNFMCNSEQ